MIEIDWNAKTDIDTVNENLKSFKTELKKIRTKHKFLIKNII